MKSFSRFLLFLLFILVVLASTIFTTHNLDPVVVWLITPLPAMPIGLWLIAAFISGGLLGILLGAGLLRRLKNRLTLRQLGAKIDQQAQEITLLKSRLSQAENAGKD